MWAGHPSVHKTKALLLFKNKCSKGAKECFVVFGWAVGVCVLFLGVL